METTPKNPPSPSSGSSVQRLVRRAIASERNSVSTAPIDDLFFEKEWWTDSMLGETYLKVPHKHDDTIHHVHCRHSDRARICYKAGKLMWLFRPTNRFYSYDRKR